MVNLAFGTIHIFLKGSHDYWLKKTAAAIWVWFLVQAITGCFHWGVL
jgi:hypothetical protein